MRLIPRTFEQVMGGIVVPIDDELGVVQILFVVYVGSRTPVTANPDDHGDDAWWSRPALERAPTRESRRRGERPPDRGE